MEIYTPEVIESFQDLAETGSVEFLSETYSHSLVALKNKDEFVRQILEHRQRIKELFNQEPTVFRNRTDLFRPDQGRCGELGFTYAHRGASILGWKSPNYLYCNAINPRLKYCCAISG
jgi:alpha-amylase